VIPKELLYTKSHEWVRLEGGRAECGITHFAQEQMGDLTFVELPRAGDSFTAGEEMGTVESVKAASEIYAPVSGTVAEVNEELESAPELVNEDPYGKGWMVRFEVSGQPEGLLSADDYAKIAES
jgi:glycine cleavage system H protein